MAKDTTDTSIKAIAVDAIIERPHLVEVGGRKHYIYPSTLGKSYITSSLIEKLNVSIELLSTNIALETLRLASTKSEEVAYIIAYATCRTKEEVFDMERIERLAEEFKSISDEDRATLLSVVLSSDQSKQLIKHFGIDKELEWMRRAERLKDKSNDSSVTFCGKSVWGTMIDFAAERYGWTLDYILWGISLTSLQMLFADHQKTVYLTDEERKKFHKPKMTDEVVDVNNMSVDEFRELLKEMQA